eukprot:5466999-Amphidinium_carterae.1
MPIGTWDTFLGELPVLKYVQLRVCVLHFVCTWVHIYSVLAMEVPCVYGPGVPVHAVQFTDCTNEAAIVYVNHHKSWLS